MAADAPRMVLYIHSSASGYGSDRCLASMVRHLDHRRYTPVVWLPADGPLVPVLVGAGARVAIIPNLAVLHRFPTVVAGLAYCCRLPLDILRLARRLRALRPAVVHVNTSSVFAGLVAARLVALPTVGHLREIRLSPPLVGRLLATIVALFADRVVAISQAVARFARSNWLGRPQVEVIHDGIEEPAPADGRRLRAELGLARQELLVGCAGRLTPWKGVHVLVDAALELCRSRQDLCFVIAGDADTPAAAAYADALRSRVVAAGLAHRIRFLGYRRDMAAVMAALDIFVLPSVEPEPFGLVTVEAMRAATPVVVTGHGGSLDIVRHGQDGLHVAPGDRDALMAAIATLAGDRQLRQRLGAAARERAGRLFTAERNAAQVTALYDGLLAVATPVALTAGEGGR